MEYNGRIYVPKREHNPRARHLPAGSLACGECGGSFASVAGRFACSWRRNRGVATCSNALRVPAAELEARGLGAIREQILVPEAVAYTVERTLAIVRAHTDREQLVSQRERLSEASREIERLVELAIRVDGLDEIAVRLKALKAEREQLASAVRAAEGGFQEKALRTDVERRLADLGAVLEASPEAGRRSLQALFRDERLRVGPDPDRSFRVEGTGASASIWRAKTPGDLRPPGVHRGW
jgi:hypothetical protein